MDQALCFLILCGVFLAGSTSAHFYQFAIDPSQPYALSYLLLVTAALLIFFGSSYLALSVIGAGMAAFLATGVNLSVILAAGAMFLAAGWFLSLRKACLFFGICAASFAFWYCVSQYYEAPSVSYYALGLRGALDNLSASLRHIAASVHPVTVALLLTALLAATILVRGEGSVPLAIFTGALIAFGLVWWMVFSQNAWTQANVMNVRYFFPTLLCLGVALAVALWARAVVAPRWAKLTLMVFLSIAILGTLVRPIRSVETYPVLAKVEDAVAFARVHGIRYVSGEYWQAWPAVFLLLDRPDAAFGMTVRGEAILSMLRQAVEGDAQSGSPVNALCLNATVAECQRLLRSLSGREWEAAPLACPGICAVLTLAPQGAQVAQKPSLASADGQPADVSRPGRDGERRRLISAVAHDAHH